MDRKILGIDYGSKRIGLALGDGDTKMAHPLKTIGNNEPMDEIKRLVEEHHIDQVVVGLPRNLDGDDTPQTALARQFTSQLENELNLPVELQDEALTSETAEVHLRKKHKGRIDPGLIDQEAACIILQDYLSNI